MLPLKLVRSLVLGEAFTLTHNSDLAKGEDDVDVDDGDGDGDTKIRHILSSSRQPRSRTRSDKNTRKTKTSLLFFVPTRELISDTYRLAAIARDLGMDLYPTPSLSHIIFSFPPPDSSSPSTSLTPPSFSSSHPSTWSSMSLSSSLSWSLPNDAVMLTFPSISASSLSNLRSFVSLSKGLFKLVFAAIEKPSVVSHWDCCSVSLLSRITGERISSMEAFSRALAGNGWTLYKTKNPLPDADQSAGNSVYLLRKIYSGRINGSCRVRELRLPHLDFRNAPLRILQYLVLMTDDLFFLA